MSFAAFDWAMSLEPHWFSTIYGILFIIGQGLSTLCLALVHRVAHLAPFRAVLRRLVREAPSSTTSAT